MPLDRDAASADALLTDLYLDSLLAGAVLDLVAAGSGGAAGRLDPATVRAAERLRHDLVRVHPSFRFEERLAARLADTAVGLQIPLAVGLDARLVPFPARPAAVGPAAGPAAAPPDGLMPPGVLLDRPGLGGLDRAARRERTRPLLIGGALTSAALSLAGAAFVAWRIGRPGRAATPMARAARAVREARLAAATALPAIDPAPRGRRLD
ncbi:MAG TPA: hypothetical protein VM427_07745 [Patescibacteria group bacterium]|nr:hypothetical protein [Patescibacteria group bacterium]